MITLKDLVGDYTLIPIPVQDIFRLFKASSRYRKLRNEYLSIHNEKVDINDRMDCLRHYQREMNAFDKMTQAKNEYDKLRDKKRIRL